MNQSIKTNAHNNKNSAQDQECGATKVDVNAYEVSPGTMALSVQDDGFGMHRGQLQNMLSFGFSSKEHVVAGGGAGPYNAFVFVFVFVYLPEWKASLM